ncbi:MAG: hypothetical protein ACOYK9_00120 [Chlamydiia bacterium]
MSKLIGKLIRREYLTPSNAEKKTIHLEIEFSEELQYLPGDSIAIDVVNPLPQVERWLKKHNRQKTERIQHRKTLEEFDLFTYLLHHVNLHSIEDGSLERARPLMPRFYSIASSSKLHPKTIHLLVTLDEFLSEEGESLMGVASYFLSSHLKLENPISFKLYPNENFRLPAPETPILMVGSGTGVAPYKAFLEERVAMNAPGFNWLVFGERHQHSHFYYQSFFKDMEKQNKLKLSLAFSRDQAEKIYVQDRLRQEAETLFSLLDAGGIIYICGDAKVMAKGVTETLEELYQQKSGSTLDEAKQWLRGLKGASQLRLDVY